MEAVLILLLLAVVAVLVGFGAKAGAERELRAREERWSRADVPLAHRAWEAIGRDDGGGARRPSTALRGAAAPSPAQGAAARRQRPGSRGAAGPSAERGGGTPARRASPGPALPPIDVNRADVEELCRLPGVGRRAAVRIVEHREAFGAFRSVSDLEEVEGFDRQRVARLASRATV